MGSFSYPTPVLMIGSCSNEASTCTTLVSFRITHMEDPWILPTPSTSSEPLETNMPLLVAMIAYQANLKNEQVLVLPLHGRRRKTPMCCRHGQYSLLMPTTALIRCSLRMKWLLRLCRELSHHGRNFIIDRTSFQRLTIWSIGICGGFLVRELVVLWFH